MITLFRKLRQRLLAEGKTSRYLKYAIGEIVLVVLGILIALQINNWNQQKLEETQVQNIYARVAQDFNNTATEIDAALVDLKENLPLMDALVRGTVSRDSLLNDADYYERYFNCFRGFPDVQINDAGVQLLASRISVNYALNTPLTEALLLLYTELKYEIEVDLESFGRSFEGLYMYILAKGIDYEFVILGEKTQFMTMIFTDLDFKKHLLAYIQLYRMHVANLEEFRNAGGALISELEGSY